MTTHDADVYIVDVIGLSSLHIGREVEIKDDGGLSLRLAINYQALSRTCNVRRLSRLIGEIRSQTIQDIPVCCAALVLRVPYGTGIQEAVDEFVKLLCQRIAALDEIEFEALFSPRYFEDSGTAVHGLPSTNDFDQEVVVALT
ncbi:MAG TPA: hypothetical protein VGA08_02675 [Candidatus Saccharimonadales bacterium]